MTMKIQYFLLALIGSLLPYILNASIIENIHFTHIGLVDGLSHSTIFAINQDKGGNLWFATYDGVNKYDGYNFTVYRHLTALPVIYPVALPLMIPTGYGWEPVRVCRFTTVTRMLSPIIIIRKEV